VLGDEMEVFRMIPGERNYVGNTMCFMSRFRILLALSAVMIATTNVSPQSLLELFARILL